MSPQDSCFSKDFPRDRSQAPLKEECPGTKLKWLIRGSDLHVCARPMERSLRCLPPTSGSRFHRYYFCQTPAAQHTQHCCYDGEPEFRLLVESSASNQRCLEAADGPSGAPRTGGLH